MKNSKMFVLFTSLLLSLSSCSFSIGGKKSSSEAASSSQENSNITSEITSEGTSEATSQGTGTSEEESEEEPSITIIEISSEEESEEPVASSEEESSIIESSEEAQSEEISDYSSSTLISSEEESEGTITISESETEYISEIEISSESEQSSESLISESSEEISSETAISESEESSESSQIPVKIHENEIIFNAKGSTSASISSFTEDMYTVYDLDISSITAEKAYKTEDGSVRLGSKTNLGTLTVTFAEEVLVKEIIVTASQYGTSTSKLTVQTLPNNISASQTITDKGKYKFSGFDSNNSLSSSFKISTLSTAKRCYIYSVKVVLGEIEEIYPTAIKVSPAEKTLGIGKTFDLSVSYTPSNTNVKKLSYSSSNIGIASVDSNGKVTGVAKGEVTITVEALSEGGSVSSTCAVSVIEELNPEVGKTNIAYNYKDLSTNLAYDLDYCPTDNAKILVIPVWFTDSNKYISTSSRDKVRSDIEKAYLGSKEETGWHSVKSYYEEESLGQFTLEGTVSSWYECGKSVSNYASLSTGGNNTTDLVKTASDWYFNNNKSESRADYDRDSNGYLDGVLLIYGAPDYHTGFNSSNSYSNLWAYCYWEQETSYKSVSSPGPNVFFWASYDFMYDSSTSYSRTGSTSYGGGDCSHCTVDAHTFIHEMGHVLGLDDYYDYGSNQYNPAGGFSMQDYNVGAHDAFSTMAYGWAHPYIPTESCEIELNPFVSSHDMILLTPSWNSFNSPFDEYLLLELFTPTGLNSFDCTYAYNGRTQGPNKVGIRLWHVDARLAYCNSTDYRGEPVFSASQLTTNPLYKCQYGVTQAFTNTYGDDDYGSVLGRDYHKYDLLHLVRNNQSVDYKTKSDLSGSDLFGNGSSFSMSSFSKQFATTGKLDSGKDLGWSFSVSISGSGDNAKAKVTLIKA
ncbi:MAG: Ig-like domain-containing protein [Bacilli bacterium]|nr:Ig-like domain-containing protein [Bacilli bacterium]